MPRKNIKTVNKQRTAAGAAGAVMLVLGVSLILAWWPDVIAFVRGMIGMVLAVGGLLILYFIKRI
jgi:uncharacterized membrane protein